MGVIKGDIHLHACIELMKEFSETARLWREVAYSDFDVLPFSESTHHKDGSLAHVNVCAAELVYDPARISVDTLIHESMHVRQYGRCPIMTRSTKFYSAEYLNKDLPCDDDGQFVILSPQSFVQAQVAMETAVWAAQVPAMYGLCQAIDDEPLFGRFLRSPYSGLSQIYPPLYELGAVRFLMRGTNEKVSFALPAEADTAALKAKFATAALAQANYSYQRTLSGNNAIKDMYASIAAQVPSVNSEYLRHHEGFDNGQIKFRPLSDEDISSLGDVWRFNVYDNPQIWRDIEKSAPLMNNDVTKSHVDHAHAILEVDKFKLK